MLTRTLSQFRSLTTPVRALIFLRWTHGLVSKTTAIFLQIYLYQKFTSVSLNITGTLIQYTGCMVGFCLFGLLAGIWRKNIKVGFLASFILMSASIFIFPHVATVYEAYAVMLLGGIGQGIFWLATNSYELAETKDHERDFYSSVINAGYQILSLAAPALAALLIWLSGSIFRFGNYTLLFTVAPILYAIGFLFFFRIRDYRPEPIKWADVRHYLMDRRNQAAQIFTMGEGFQHILGTIVPPLIILLVLGTTLKVGIYNAFFAIFSALCVMFVAQYRTSSNRLHIYSLTTSLFVLATLVYGYSLSFAGLVFYTVIDGIVTPVMNVSVHVIDLAAMEIGRSDADFYATMMLREFFLWVWRTVAGLALLFIITFLGTEKAELTAGMYLYAGGFIIAYLGAFLLLKYQSKKKTAGVVGGVL